MDIPRVEDITQTSENDPENCSICLNFFDHKSRRPRCLPCGHSLCSECLNKLMVGYTTTCPNCRMSHMACNATQFPINYSMEALLLKLRTMEVASKSLESEENGAIGGLHFEAASILAGEVESVNNSISVGESRECTENSSLQKLNLLAKKETKRVQGLSEEYKNMLERLVDFQKILQILVEQQEQQLDSIASKPPNQKQFLQDLEDETKATLHQLKMKMDVVSSLKKEVFKRRKVASKVLKSMIQLATSGDLRTDPYIGECEGCNNIKKDLNEKCAAVLDDSKLEASRRVLAEGRNALNMMSLTDDIQRRSDSSFIEVRNLTEMTEEIESLLRSRRVFALQRRMGGETDKVRFAEISVRDSNDGGPKQLYVHHLQDQPPPSNVKFVPYDEVYGLVNSQPSLTFLDFSWGGGTGEGRVIIKLDPSDTRRANQFALLCMGLWGPTYHNTRLLAVGNRGLPSEFVRGGDYQYNNGTGGQSLLEGIGRDGPYWRRQVSGSVMSAACWGDPCSAQFIISTRSPERAQRDDAIFGQVEEGLQVLNAAIRDSQRVTQVVVSECGIVVPL